ncbi:MAG: alanine/glycine:cation symporter family protein [Sphaerochaetaceae bacterium]
MTFVEKLAGWIWGLPLIVIILGIGVFFTVGTGFYQFTKFGHIMNETFGKLIRKHDGEEGSDGIISPFQAVASAIGGSVGVGNIAGVATAIAIGGPGAILWMWIAALLGMGIKMAEVTLAVYYRKKDEKGNPYGGPTYYMEYGMGEEKKLGWWKIMSIVFGLGIFSSFFLTVQNYSVSEAVGNSFGIPLGIVAVVYTSLVYIITSGGIPSLGKWAGIMVPIMCLFYVVIGLFVIFKNAAELPNAFALIFSGGVSGTSAVGGFAGAAAAKSIQLGMARAVYSNEAGWGTSPIIHSTARTDHPVRQGMWGAFEVFVDSMIVCTITALVIIVTGEWQSGVEGATLTLNAFQNEIGIVGRITMATSVFLFGLTTTTGWYAYYEVILRHTFGNHSKTKDRILKLYKWIYPLPGLTMTFYAVLGGQSPANLWLISDITTGIPTFVNVIALVVLAPKFISLVKDYKARHLGIGTVDPDFKVFYEDEPAKDDKNLEPVVNRI